MLVFKKKGKKFDQDNYDFFFHAIENDLRELGLGDVSVNKKMKEFNKILYDILLKIEQDIKDIKKFKINKKLILKYFEEIKSEDISKITLLDYFVSFFNYCFAKTSNNMVEESINFNF